MLRVDASEYAIGATLEQLVDEDRKPTMQDLKDKKTVPVAFFSRKLAPGQTKWVPREQETYAIVEALRKWRSILGVQPITIFTDHKALEEWYHEEVETPSGPTGRRLRWHETLSDHDLTVQYIPGKNNGLADAMSRWAYPASKGYRDISRHGSAKDAEDVKEIIRQEKEEEANAIYKVNSQGANATVLRNFARSANPVGAEAESSASPPRLFAFRDPAEGPSEWARRQARSRGRGMGQRARQGRGLPRKSPPPREVGPDNFSPDGNLRDENSEGELPELDLASESVSDEDMPEEMWDEAGENVQSETPQNAPVGSTMRENWGEFYSQCPWWGEMWSGLGQPENWPSDVQVIGGRMFIGTKLCIPLPLQREWIRRCHNAHHRGHERTWKLMNDRYDWADKVGAWRFSKQVNRQCEVCQACNRPRNRLGPIVHTPIPPTVMSHIAIDVFVLPTIRVEHKSYDCVVLGVDRHSGWLTVIPEFRQGLTGQGVAKAFLKQWSMFGVPAKITTDEGPQFRNSWWRHMCATLGIIHMYSPPYHHQANGRAERAGQELIEVLRKLHTETRQNWLDLLPRALNIIHDTPGESGLSPYNILFGRERFMANMPYNPPRLCEDAEDFFERMDEIDRRVAEVVNKRHEEEAARINAHRRDLEPIPIGSKVWYLRPKGSGTKLDTRWLGPMVVLAREGESTYTISTALGGDSMVAHRTFLKLYVEDECNERPIPMHFHKRTVKFSEEHPGKLMVKRIIDHRVDPEGNVSFLVHREGVTITDAEFTPVQDFLDGNTQKLVEYCSQNGLDGVLGILSVVPH